MVLSVETESAIEDGAPRIAGRLMISTDLDATLLDEAYCWEPARPALDKLAEQGAVLVLNSSKTVREMRSLAAELCAECGFEPAPIVAENGGVLAVPDSEEPDGYRVNALGMPRREILKVAHALRDEEQFCFEGFADMQPEELVAHTGLSTEGAQKAMARETTEPILWQDSPERWALFESALAEAGIRVVRGGQFFHLMGKMDKADGQRAALDFLEQEHPGEVWNMVALGDSPNDQGMLDAADIAVAIQNRSQGMRLQPKAKQKLFPAGFGPEAWNEAIHTILNRKAGT